tara:strand:+ start:19 stop:564 length:546 start_codon:yes stop_codon:yes gene_type:complete
MGQFGNQPDFATNDIKAIVPSDTISLATKLNSSVVYIGDNTGDVIILIPAGSVGSSVVSAFSSPGYTGSKGTGYTTAAAVATTGGSGTGLTVDITVSSGSVQAVAVNVAGTGYLNGDLITITGGDTNAVFRVEAIPGLPTEAQAVVFKGVQAGGFLPVIVDYVLATKGAATTTVDSLIAAK